MPKKEHIQQFLDTNLPGWETKYTLVPESKIKLAESQIRHQLVSPRGANRMFALSEVEADPSAFPDIYLNSTHVQPERPHDIPRLIGLAEAALAEEHIPTGFTTQRVTVRPPYHGTKGQVLNMQWIDPELEADLHFKASGSSSAKTSRISLTCDEANNILTFGMERIAELPKVIKSPTETLYRQAILKWNASISELLRVRAATHPLPQEAQPKFPLLTGFSVSPKGAAKSGPTMRLLKARSGQFIHPKVMRWRLSPRDGNKYQPIAPSQEYSLVALDTMQGTLNIHPDGTMEYYAGGSPDNPPQYLRDIGAFLIDHGILSSMPIWEDIDTHKHDELHKPQPTPTTTTTNLDLI